MHLTEYYDGVKRHELSVRLDEEYFQRLVVDIFDKRRALEYLDNVARVSCT